MDKPSSPKFSISFHDIDEERLGLSIDHLRLWLDKLSQHYQKPVDQLDYILCSDSFLLELNRRYLDHDYLTDILTFPYDYTPIRGEVYISIDRAEDNAVSLRLNTEDEILRLVAHGFLHMCGWKDGSDTERAEMRQEEDICIELFSKT